MANFYEIDTFIFDVDGVLTDGSVLSFAHGEHVRRFYVKDGFAIEKALSMGYTIVIISGGFEEGVRKRLEFLGIKHLLLGIKNKVAAFEAFIQENHLEKHRILYMGDDLPDYHMLKLSGLPTCPSDAAEDIKNICSYVSTFPGGRGAVRDVIEKVLKAQGKWFIDP